MNELAPLMHTLRGVRRRLRVQKALEALSLSLPAALLLQAGAWLSERLQHPWPPVVVLCAWLLPPLAVAVALLLPQPLAKAAERLDRSHALKSRTRSALDFADEQTLTPFMQAALRDAVEHARGASPRRAVPLRRPRGTHLLATALVVLAVSRWVPLPSPQPAPGPPQLPPAETARVLDPDTLDAFREDLERLGAVKDERLEERYERVLEQLERGELSREEALAELEAMAAQLRAVDESFSQALTSGLRRLSRALGEHAGTAELGEALAAQNLDLAAEQARRLAETLEGGRKREREALAKALREAAQAARRDAAQGAKQEPSNERNLLRKPPSPDGDDEPSLLRKQRERELERLRREQAAQEQARRELERLRRQLEQAGKQGGAGGSEQLQQGEQTLRDLQRQQRALEENRELARQLEQLRQQLQRQSGQQSGPGAQGQGGQDERMQRFRLRAGGKSPQEGRQQPRVAPPPGPDAGRRDAGAQPSGGGTDRQRPDAGSGRDAGAPVLQLGGEGEPNAILEMPGMSESQRTTSASDESRSDRSDADERLEGQMRDSQLSGVSSQGPSRSQVILGAADQGFSSAPYGQVYTDYRSHAEDVLKRDEVPPGYRFYVRRYFQLIRPRGEDNSK